ncbi:MAG: O-antigen ligase family protein, partial [Chloroflexi bacterium]|nr:O-antigen ligase family protein [Chloroflexota bacterium]
MAAVAAAAMVAFILQRPRYLVYFLGFYTPFELFLIKWLPEMAGTVVRYGSEALLLLSLVAIVLYRLQQRRFLKRTPLDIPLLFFVGFAVLSALLNGIRSEVALLGLRILLRYVVLYYLVVNISLSRERVVFLLRGLLVVAFIVAMVGVLEGFVGDPAHEFLSVSEIRLGEVALRSVSSGASTGRFRFVFSTLGRYDALGTYLVVFTVLAGTLGYHFPHLRRWLVSALIVFGLSLAMTYSRQSWLAVYMAGLAFAFLVRKRHPWGVPLLLSFPVILVLIGLSFSHLLRFFPGSLDEVSLIERALEPLSPQYQEVSLYQGGRMFVIRFVGERIMQQAPWLGFGPGRFGNLTAEFFGENAVELVTDNMAQASLVNDVNWIVVLGQYGALGTAAFLWMHVSMLYFAWRTHHRNKDPLLRAVALACILCIVSAFVLGFTGPNLEQRAFSAYVWLVPV